MEDFRRVGHGPFKPQCCALCDSQKDLTDTHRELLHWGHVYVCELCVQRLARANGLAEGVEQDKLLGAGRLLEQAEEEITDLKERLLVANTAEAESRFALDQAHEELAQRDGRIAQLEEAIRQHARQELELVGVGHTDDPVDDGEDAAAKRPRFRR